MSGRSGARATLCIKGLKQSYRHAHQASSCLVLSVVASICRFVSCLQTAVAVAIIRHQFGRQGIPGQQWGNVLLHRVAVCHAADGDHHHRRMRLPNEQTHRHRHVHLVHLLRRRNSATRVRSFTLHTVLLTAGARPWGTGRVQSSNPHLPPRPSMGYVQNLIEFLGNPHPPKIFSHQLVPSS